MKININNTDELTKELDIVQKESIVRTIDAEMMQTMVRRIENRLSQLLPKTYHEGIIADVDICAQNFPNAYKGRPESTYFEVKRFPSGWFVTKIERNYCLIRNQKVILRMSMEHKHLIAEHVIQYKNWE